MNELYHYGVKGMKWGVRKSRTPSINSRRRSTKSKSYKNVAISGAKFCVWALAMYAGVSVVRNQTIRHYAKQGKKVTKDIFEAAEITRKDGRPISPSEIERLKDLGFI